MSTSISRGPLRNVLVRPTRRSTSFSAESSAAGEPVQRIAATAFQNVRCAVKPTGSVR